MGAIINFTTYVSAVKKLKLTNSVTKIEPNFLSVNLHVDSSKTSFVSIVVVCVLL